MIFIYLIAGLKNMLQVQHTELPKFSTCSRVFDPSLTCDSRGYSVLVRLSLTGTQSLLFHASAQTFPTKSDSELDMS